MKVIANPFEDIHPYESEVEYLEDIKRAFAESGIMLSNQEAKEAKKTFSSLFKVFL